MNDKASIQKSRIGLNYQNKYCLKEIIKHLLDKQLEGAYVDYPLSDNQRSLDLLLIFKDGSQSIYEIKTGERFKTSKYKTVGEILQIMIEYEQNESESTELNPSLIVENLNTPEIYENFSDLMFIKHKSINAKNRKGETFNNVLSRCYEEYGIKNTGISQDGFKEFITEQLSLEEGPKYTPNNRIAMGTDLDKELFGQITDISRELDLGKECVEVPNKIVVLELLDCIDCCVESAQNIIEPISMVLLKSLARRALVNKARYDSGKSVVLVKNEKEDLRKPLSSVLGVEIKETIDVKPKEDL